MLVVQHLFLPFHEPVEGCELTPFVLLEGDHKADDVTEFKPIDGHYLRYRWYRIIQNDEDINASDDPPEDGVCNDTVHAHSAGSHHCSNKCYSSVWQHRNLVHQRSLKMFGFDCRIFFLRTTKPNQNLSNSFISAVRGKRTLTFEVETTIEVGSSKTYTPTAADIGHALKFECCVVNLETKVPVIETVGRAPDNTKYGGEILTSLVIPAPTPIPRRLIPVGGIDTSRDGRISSGETFTVLSYNIHSGDIVPQLGPSCNPNEEYVTWAYRPNEQYLTWAYRRQNLLREIVGYNADIICLQEVHRDYFEKFFAPQLAIHGYEAVFKLKYPQFEDELDNGCATFFRSDKFSPLQKLAVGSVSLIITLESKDNNKCIDIPGKLCVANTHVHEPREVPGDKKLNRVDHLTRELKDMAARADIPMVVCGDFDAVPGSAPHEFLISGGVNPRHPDLDDYCSLDKFAHKFSLVSAYSSYDSIDELLGPEIRPKLSIYTKEPHFTMSTRDFMGTHDYIFYSDDTLAVETLLELLDEDSLCEGGSCRSCRNDKRVLPSPELSSDHIGLLAGFKLKPKKPDPPHYTKSPEKKKIKRHS